jgi:hypothetical protein
VPVVCTAVVIVAVIVLIVTGVFGAGYSYPVTNHHGRTQALTIVGLLVTGPGLLAMWLIRERLATMTPPGSSDWPAVARQAGELLALRDRLSRVLLILGLVIGAATLSTGALRGAVLASGSETAAQAPEIDPWLYGAWLTLLLGVFYFPAYLELQRVSRRLADAVYPLSWQAEPDSNWYQDRANLIALLKLDLGPLAAFRTGVAILGPLLGSLLGLLLPTGK